MGDACRMRRFPIGLFLRRIDVLHMCAAVGCRAGRRPATEEELGVRITVVSAEEAVARSWVRAGEPLDRGSAGHLADELRAHMLALGAAPRASLLRRVARLLSPLGAVDEGRLEETCRALERRGDVLGAPGGVVAAAPLRLVATGTERWLVVGCLPTVALRRALPGVTVSAGVGRTAIVAAAERVGLQGAVESLGGRLLSAEEWAGLLRTPPADGAWLEELAQRLDGEGALENWGLATRWDEAFAYRARGGEGGALRWEKVAQTESASLLRARQAGGWFAYGWGTLRGPGQAPRPFVELTRDEARRTERAIDRAGGAPRSLSVSNVPESARSAGALPASSGDAPEGLLWMALDVGLPSAEYRFLLALAEASGEDARPVRLGFSEEGLARATSVLRERLGVEVRGTGALASV